MLLQLPKQAAVKAAVDYSAAAEERRALRASCHARVGCVQYCNWMGCGNSGAAGIVNVYTSGSTEDFGELAVAIEGNEMLLR